MKKIIAAAIATAFIAPAFAADVTISGYMEMTLADETTASTSSKSIQEDGTVSIKATEELANGMTVSADFGISGNAGDDGGSSLTLSGEFGTVDLGETSGAIDSIDDKGDLFKVIDNGISAVSTDAAVNWKLPTFVEGLTVVAAYSPENGDDNTINTEALGSSYANQAGSLSDDVSGISARYSFGSVTVAYGQETVGTTDNSDFNVQYSSGPIFVSHEVATSETTAGVETDYTSTAFAYSMGDTKLIIGNKKTDSLTATSDRDLTSYGIQHSIGGLTLFAETSSEDKATTKHEGTYVGASFTF